MPGKNRVRPREHHLHHHRRQFPEQHLELAKPKLTVSAGLVVGSTGDQVWVAAGVCIEQITLKSGVVLYGGFDGNETQLVHRNWASHATILDGSDDRLSHGSVVTASSGVTASTRIDSFITAGKAGWPTLIFGFFAREGLCRS